MAQVPGVPGAKEGGEGVNETGLGAQS